MKAIIVPMTKCEKLQQINEELESTRYQDFLKLQRIRGVRESVNINGVRHVRIKQTHVCRKRLIENEDCSQTEKDMESDWYWEYLMENE